MTRHLRFSAAGLALLLAACATPNLDEDDDLPPVVPDIPSAAPVGGGDPVVMAPEASPAPTGTPDTTPSPTPAEAATCALAVPVPPAVLTVRWSATAPTGYSGATPAVRERIILPDCTMEVSTLLLSAQPASASSWTTYLRKKDTTPGSCKEQKGYATLVAKTYAVPLVKVATHPTAPRLFVVAYSKKTTEDGTLAHEMEQIDWVTGATLHIASPYVKGKPQMFPRPSSYPSAVAINGCDVTLLGRGSFSGATGTSTDEWVATYPGFIAPQRQAPSGAALAAYE